MTDDVRRAWAYLSRVAEPPCGSLVALVEEVGPEAAADMVRRQEFADGFEAVADGTVGRAQEDRAEADLAHIAHLGGRLVTPDDEEWPEQALRRLAERLPSEDTEHEDEVRELRPVALWVVGRGRLDELLERSVAMVGTRAPSSYGERVTDDFAGDLAAEGFTIVSGGAYGIDGAAHRAALAAEGTTVAFVAGGLDRPYPAGHAGLFRRIAETGLVASEYPPGGVPARHRFLNRNRIVGTATGGVVVVEAGFRSGTKNTATWARRRGVPVCAVPGPVTAATSVSCHQLIREGAVLVTRSAEVIEEVGRIGELALELDVPARPTDGLDGVALRVHGALPAKSALPVSEIAVIAGLPARAVMGRLALLETKGLVRRDGALWRLDG
ncbi:DNA-protecting protein DprA [Tsukamurella tyrosinosolvens]|uniref:DNA-processing protein DprA n=1 Tax=Tsukamurella tyrosinosolvens TaxID=57704 RepID=UPI00079CA972|nr:DNA-processing protein DprA [Tsukamurella tyrosinosolvens]KXP05562.1 DNA processing protein DprA [Tsukamurella tyrosinosolvens]KZL95380.1 DNA processing protein DprA [Tsukamurella tyrosinosolvens]MCA4993872.1 DNA-protecting protein DprA [Tsukamurella tyrosinosolvens]WEL94681.1 DNA-processing protein DprA [Tsukamurella tyrosinosolvens]